MMCRPRDGVQRALRWLYRGVLGVADADVGIDYAGFHTYDTCYRASAVFGVSSAALVSQTFHLARAVFTCGGLGIDAIGVRADLHRYPGAAWYLLREQVARARAYLQIRLTRPRPHFLGSNVPLS